MPVVWIQNWLRVQAVVWLPLLGAIAAMGTHATDRAWAVGVAAGIGGSIAVLAMRLRTSRPADLLTLLRLAVVACVVATAARPLGGAAWLVCVAAAAADLVDGVVARRTGPTPAGAQLDMEADQLTVLALSICIVQGGGLPHVLLLPAVRYAFVLAAWCWRIPAHEPKPVAGDNRRGRRICAAVVLALLMALAPGAPRGLGDAATAAAVGLLGWSFSADARHLLAARRSRRRA